MHEQDHDDDFSGEVEVDELPEIIGREECLRCDRVYHEKYYVKNEWRCDRCKDEEM